jgi:hypothetical protein
VTESKVYPLIMKSEENISGPPEKNELRAIHLKNGKNPVDKMQLQVKAPNIPNHAKISVKLPDEEEFENFGDLPIINGEVFLPVPFVFLSHASEDAEAVREVNADLRRAGILTWLDKQQLLPGDDWERKIDEAIDNSDYVLIFLSSKSINKKGIFQKEIKYAFDKVLEVPSGQAFVIPILLEEIQPPREFSSIHWAKAWESGWLDLLVKSLRR